MKLYLQRGFTVIELMMTIAVLAVLVTVAIPSFGSFIGNNRITAQANTFHSSLLYARSEAVKQNRPVFMCRSGDISHATNPCGQTNNGWHDGWVMFVDLDQDGTFDAGETIRTNEGFAGGSTLVETSTTPLAQISYQGDGRISAGSSSASFKFCDSKNNDEYTRQLSISPLGNPRVTRTGSCP